MSKAHARCLAPCPFGASSCGASAPAGSPPCPVNWTAEPSWNGPTGPDSRNPEKNFFGMFGIFRNV